MSVQMNIAEAKSKLSELVARAERGERVVLARKGKPAVILTPLAAQDQPLTPFQKACGAFARLGELSDEANALLMAPADDFDEDQAWWT